jgi:hypothetical protein
LTTGFAGAGLANLVNKAAIVATRRKGEAVTLDGFTAAIERIVAGLEKKSGVLGPAERGRVAHREMGHALVAATLPGVDPFHKVSIVPRGVRARLYDAGTVCGGDGIEGPSAGDKNQRQPELSIVRETHMLDKPTKDMEPTPGWRFLEFPGLGDGRDKAVLRDPALVEANLGSPSAQARMWWWNLPTIVFCGTPRAREPHRHPEPLVTNLWRRHR